MKKHTPIIVLIMSLLSMSLIKPFEYSTELKISGEWEFEKVKVKGIEKTASDLNNCGYKDVLEIREQKEVESYEFDGIKIIGKRIGISNKKICVADPVEYRYRVLYNSCPTDWIRISNTKNRIVSISEGLVTEYEIRKPNREKMILSRVREIVNFGASVPDEIQLKKIKKSSDD